ncbi:hypothetical protein ACNQFZ_01275 [Schinkia sp. CFF1]
MRRKRSARKKKMRKKALYQTASLISIAAFGIAQVTPTSHAVFSHSVTIKDGEITSSFVFPETIDGLVNEIKTEMDKVQSLREQAGMVYGKLEQAESSEQAISDNRLDEILETAKTSQEVANTKLNQLNIYLAQAKLEVIDDESAMNILKVIEDGTKNATELTDSMTIVIKEMEGMANQANDMIAAMIQAEAAALEKDMIAEIAKKALEGLTDANTNAADILAKYGPDFDINAFQTLTEEFAKSETDLQKALEDAENYMNELKAYVDGTKEVASPDVLEEAKANYEKVQQAIDSLKETMDNTKQTNTEVQAKIEQEKQRQEEEAQRVEQERLKQEEEAKNAQQSSENQSTPGADGGPANSQTPVEEENPTQNTPPASENPTPDVPVSGGGGGGTSTPDKPPAEGDQPNPEQPPGGGENQVPDQPPVGEDQPNTNQPPVGEDQPNTNQPPVGEDQPNTNQPPIEEDQSTPDKPPVTDENQNPETPPMNGEEPSKEIPQQPARPNDDDSQSNNQDDGGNPDHPSGDDGKNADQQSPVVNEDTTNQENNGETVGNLTEATNEDDTDTELTNSDEQTAVEGTAIEGNSSNNEESTQATETTTTENGSSENNSSETQSTDESTSESESIDRGTLVAFNTTRREDEVDLFTLTPEFYNHDIQSDFVTTDNNHQVKINIRTYLWSKWNKKL